MSILEIALIILVVIWSIIFAIIAIALIMVVFAIKRAIKKTNNILDKTEAVADKADIPSKVITASIIAFMAKNSIGPITRLIVGFLNRKKS